MNTLMRSTERASARPFWAAFLAGVAGAALMTVLMWMGLWMQWSPFSFEVLLGSLVTGTIGPEAWSLGFVWHLLNGGIFGLIYAAIFSASRRSGTSFGALLGVAHWVAAGIFIRYLYVIYPLAVAPLAVANEIEGVWFYWTHYGGMTFFSSLILHIVYGAIVGYAYHRSIQSLRAQKAPETDLRRVA